MSINRIKADAGKRGGAARQSYWRRGLCEACVPGMSQRSEVEVLRPARWRRRTRETQGRHREVGSEGSVERTRGARNTNLI